MMAIRRIGIMVFVGGLSFLSACSAQSGGGSQQSAAGSAGPTACQIDAKKVCQQFKDASSVDASDTGLQLDGHALEDSGLRTLNIHYAYPIPNSQVLEVDCQINAAHKSVIYARLLKGPALTESDIQYLRSNGLCEE